MCAHSCAWRPAEPTVCLLTASSERARRGFPSSLESIRTPLKLQMILVGGKKTCPGNTCNILAFLNPKHNFKCRNALISQVCKESFLGLCDETCCALFVLWELIMFWFWLYICMAFFLFFFFFYPTNIFQTNHHGQQFKNQTENCRPRKRPRGYKEKWAL